MEYQKIINLLGNTSDNKVPRFITKNELKFMMNLEEHTSKTKKLDLKHLN